MSRSAAKWDRKTNFEETRIRRVRETVGVGTTRKNNLKRAVVRRFGVKDLGLKGGGIDLRLAKKKGLIVGKKEALRKTRQSEAIGNNRSTKTGGN